MAIRRKLVRGLLGLSLVKRWAAAESARLLRDGDKALTDHDFCRAVLQRVRSPRKRQQLLEAIRAA